MRMTTFAATALMALLAPPSAASSEPMNWTGPWLGVTAAMRTDITAARPVSTPWLPSDEIFRGGSIQPTIGLNAGYDFQFGRFVAGPIVGIDFSNSRQSGSIPYFGARAGFLASDQLLLFVMAGAQSMQHSVDATLNYGASGIGLIGWSPVPVSTRAGRRWGGFVGAGAEYRLSANWALTADYSYAQTSGAFGGDVNFAHPFLPFVRLTAPANLATTVSTHTFRVGVKYRLSGDDRTAAVPLENSTGEPMTWTGAWLGANAGMRTDAGLSYWPGSNLSDPGVGDRSMTANGTIGINAGYDVQFGRFVGGAIAGMDFSAAPLSGNMPYFGLRAGVLASDRLLLFVMGGAQSMQNAGVANSWSSSAAENWVLRARPYSVKSGRQWGPFFGAGAEYRLTANWSFSTDYSYSRTRGLFEGDKNWLDGSGIITPGTFGSRMNHVSSHTFRIGVKYRL
jgi:opacity protein-like surface antigen